MWAFPGLASSELGLCSSFQHCLYSAQDNDWHGIRKIGAQWKNELRTNKWMIFKCNITYHSTLWWLPSPTPTEDKIKSYCPVWQTRPSLIWHGLRLLAYLSHSLLWILCINNILENSIILCFMFQLTSLCLECPCQILLPSISFSPNSSIPFKNMENNVYHILPCTFIKIKHFSILTSDFLYSWTSSCVLHQSPLFLLFSTGIYYLDFGFYHSYVFHNFYWYFKNLPSPSDSNALI